MKECLRHFIVKEGWKEGW